jgi:cation transport ATPase
MRTVFNIGLYCSTKPGGFAASPYLDINEAVARTARAHREMKAQYTIRIVRTIVIAVAVLFGAVTLFAGGQVLLGSDPGYHVFMPLLIFNTAMGLMYMAAGVAAWRSVNAGWKAAAAIFLLNLLVLTGILVIYLSGGVVAVDSLRAMTFRTVVWLVLFLGAFWLARQKAAARLQGLL